jgi:hypothetical protein
VHSHRGQLYSQFDETPLHLAASLCEDRSEKVGGYLAVVKLLVAQGGDLVMPDNVCARCDA